MINSLSIAVHAFVSHVSMSFSVDDTLLQLMVAKNLVSFKSKLHWSIINWTNEEFKQMDQKTRKLTKNKTMH